MLKVYTDGGSRGNPGPAACAFVVFDDAGNLRYKRGKYLGVATNNEAEYAGVIEALRYFQPKAGPPLAERDLSVQFFLDSLLVVNQLNGLWKVKEPRLRELVIQVRSLENGLAVTYSHVPREQNSQADFLVNETLDGQMR